MVYYPPPFVATVLHEEVERGVSITFVGGKRRVNKESLLSGYKLNGVNGLGKEGGGDFVYFGGEYLRDRAFFEKCGAENLRDFVHGSFQLQSPL